MHWATDAGMEWWGASCIWLDTQQAPHQIMLYIHKYWTRYCYFNSIPPPWNSVCILFSFTFQVEGSCDVCYFCMLTWEQYNIKGDTSEHGGFSKHHKAGGGWLTYCDSTRGAGCSLLHYIYEPRKGKVFVFLSKMAKITSAKCLRLALMGLHKFIILRKPKRFKQMNKYLVHFTFFLYCTMFSIYIISVLFIYWSVFSTK